MDTRTVDMEEVHRQYLANPNDETLNELIEACQGLIIYFARLYGGNYCLEDICQCGYEGLLKGIKNFDPNRSVKFVTYASHAIIGDIRHYVRKERRYYYPPYLENYQKKADQIITTHLEKEKEVISEKELADLLNLHPESVLPVMSAGLVHLGHLDIASIKAKEQESFTLPIEDKLFLSQLKYHLTDIQKDVIEMLYNDGMTQEEVAKELGLTQKQVSRIKLKSLEKMKGKIKGKKD
ncbi:MAG: sigma-70 family RNA polymerase sigma factor [Anaerovoracaceae bacterium]|jgi:RNA polymerase sigma-B factor